MHSLDVIIKSLAIILDSWHRHK